MQPECWTVRLYTRTSKIDATTGTRTSQHEPYEKDFTGGELWKMLFHGLSDLTQVNSKARPDETAGH